MVKEKYWFFLDFREFSFDQTVSSKRVKENALTLSNISHLVRTLRIWAAPVMKLYYSSKIPFSLLMICAISIPLPGTGEIKNRLTPRYTPASP